MSVWVSTPGESQEVKVRVFYIKQINTLLAELVDALDLGSSIERCESSSLSEGTKNRSG